MDSDLPPEQDDIEDCLYAFTVVVRPDMTVSVLPEIEVGTRKFSLDGPFHTPSLISMACGQVIAQIERFAMTTEIVTSLKSVSESGGTLQGFDLAGELLLLKNEQDALEDLRRSAE